MPDVQEVFRMATQKVRPDQGFTDRQLYHQRRRTRNRKAAALVLVGAIGVVVIAVILASRGGGNATTPADESPAVGLTTAEELARDFVGAYGAFDAERAITYLAEDADISELMAAVGAAGSEGGPDELRSLTSLLEAMRYQQILGRCEEQGGSTSGIRVRCAFAFHLLGSYQMGRGPFGGSSFDVTVRDGRIVRASQSFETEEFSPQMWEPFAGWVSSTHPDDATVMYRDGTFSGARLTEESTELWRERTLEYVREILRAYGPGQLDGPSVGKHTRIVDGVSFSFTVPSFGWEQFGSISINKSIVGPQGAEGIIFWTSPDGDNADACADLLSPTVGRSAADLAAAIAAAPGTELVSGPSDVTVGGRAAKHVVLTVREDVGCDPGYFYTWQDVWWGALWPETNVGDTIRVWIVEVGGTLLFIEAETNQDASSSLVDEIEQIVGSIRFD